MKFSLFLTFYVIELSVFATGLKTSYDPKEYFNRPAVSSPNQLTFETGWKSLNPELLRKNLLKTIVPPQDGNPDFTYSCGPISFALATTLINGGKDRSSHHWSSRMKDEWVLWIKTMSRYKDSQDPRLTYPDFLTMGYNSMSVFKLSAKHITKDSFPGALELIKSQIDQGNPVVVVLHAGFSGSHYVLIVGYNSETRQIAFLDPDEYLRIFPYEWLDRMMYVGVMIDEGISYFSHALFQMPALSLGSTLGYYNLIVFEKD